jgi:hypothetical protein
MTYPGNTPGKWEYVEELGEVWAKHEHTDDFRVCIVEASNADGTLLAASKEMLDMLQFLRKFLAYTELVKVDKVIAKAEGK